MSSAPSGRAIVALKAATIQILSGNRFRLGLGLGAGENLNELVVGHGWPAVGVRQEMLSEAVDIIAALFDDEQRVNYRGRHFDVEQARLWDRPSTRVPIGIAVSGKSSCELAGHKADLMVAVEPMAELGEMFDAAVALVEIGAGSQEAFIDWAQEKLLPALRSL